MAGGDTATPGSSNMDSAHKTPKDRKCPYCSELFTSSSLGRHLDQFIKEDKPKPPDGKHDVEEIRSTRGAVTRRQARLSSAKRDISAINAQADGSPPAKKAKFNGLPATFNGPSLESTGVLPELANLPGPALYATDMKSTDFVKKQREAVQERDEGRASKLALIEILDNIHAAESRDTPSTPFHFDFLAQSFPSLVLQILPRQPTILSSQLIPSAKCWPLHPPGKAHYDLLRKALSDRLDELEMERRTARRQRDSEDTSTSHSSDNQQPLDHSSYYEHLENAYKAWSPTHESEKHLQYRLEFARAYAREQEAHSETKLKLQEMEKRIAHNEIQITRLSELQQPTEFLRNPNKAQPYSGELAKIIAEKHGTDRIPTAEVLINKWRPSVQNNRGWQRGFVAQMNLAAMAEHGIDGLPDSAYTPNGLDGPQTNGTDQSMAAMDQEDGDSVDASGEDDDEIMAPANSRNPTGIPMEHMIDPNLGADAGDFGAATLLADITSKAKRQR